MLLGDAIEVNENDERSHVEQMKCPVAIEVFNDDYAIALVTSQFQRAVNNGAHRISKEPSEGIAYSSNQRSDEVTENESEKTAIVVD